MAEKKKKRFFLIDYENVHMAGLTGIEELHKSDTVIIFYSRNSDSLSFETMKKLGEAKASIKYIMVDTIGRNALDFQLSSYIGFLLGRQPDSRCYIVSNDKGYNNVQIFWYKMGERVRLIPNIHVRKVTHITMPDVERALSDLTNMSEEQKSHAVELVWKHLRLESPHLSSTKVSINNELLHFFTGEQTKVIFDALKPLLKIN